MEHITGGTNHHSITTSIRIEESTVKILFMTMVSLFIQGFLSLIGLGNQTTMYGILVIQVLYLFIDAFEESRACSFKKLKMLWMSVLVSAISIGFLCAINEFFSSYDPEAFFVQFFKRNLLFGGATFYATLLVYLGQAVGFF